MGSLPAFELNLSDYVLRWLSPDDAELLPQLLDRCSDYTLLVEGESVAPAAAQELFQAVPPGRQICVWPDQSPGRDRRAHKFWHRLGFEDVQITEPRQFGKKWQPVTVMRRNIAAPPGY